MVLINCILFQYYLKTGTCKFGASCKFHHPRHVVGSLSNVPLNISGYPLRPVWTSMLNLFNLCLEVRFFLELVAYVCTIVHCNRVRKNAPIIWKRGSANLAWLVNSIILSLLLHHFQHLHLNFIHRCSLPLFIYLNNMEEYLLTWLGLLFYILHMYHQGDMVLFCILQE